MRQESGSGSGDSTLGRRIRYRASPRGRIQTRSSTRATLGGRWHAECVRGAQHRVHHRRPHALPLIPGIDCDRAKCSDGASFDRCPTADDVANKVTITIGTRDSRGMTKRRDARAFGNVP
jgi:hypothetical protein